MKTKLLGTVFLAIAAAYSLTGCSSAPVNIEVNYNANSIANSANAEPVGTPVAGGGEDQPASAEALVADLYKQHNANKSPFFQKKNRALVDKYFTKQLADLIWKDARTFQGEVGAIDFDPLYFAQDYKIDNFAVGVAEVKGQSATVPVTFTNYGRKQTVTFALKQVESAWKIDDIKYGIGDGLLKGLKDAYFNKPASDFSGVFEGKFQVGETSCSVTPAKMGFEVRWAKGSGVEMFFIQGDNTFTSYPEKAEPNSFVFDDAEYNTGEFRRGDGKTFAVKRLK
jgi:hypothetical protein